ncbi:MAG: helix-turn-helix transcriptional regulator [Bacteroidales bacterium]|nr:helix-turn-helix transcriptional regulator [Bacteroidales bacterium]
MKINNISAWLRTLAERGFSARAVIEQPQDRNLERENRAYCQEYQRSKALFMRVDRLVKKEALYKDSELTLNKLAAIVGTNRTYLSRAFSVSGENFRDYLFHLRMQELEKVLEDKALCDKLEKEDVDYYAVVGFSATRALDRRLLQERGITYRQMIKRKDNS